MSTVFDLIALGIMGFLQWYSEEALSGPDLVSYFIKQLGMFVLLQLILLIIPFLRKIIGRLWFPFRFFHVYLHVYTAKEIAQELEKKKEEEDDFDDVLDRHNLRTSFVTGLGSNDENSMLVASFSRIGYAKRVALAPSRFGWIMLIGYLVISPLALAGNMLTNTIGALFHFYFFVGIFGVMMPTLNDWLYLLNTLILNLNIRPIFIFNSILVHVVFTFDAFWRTNDFWIAILIGTIMFVVYLGGLIMVAMIALQRKLKSSNIFFVPFKLPKELQKSFLDVEFHHLDEFDLDD